MSLFEDCPLDEALTEIPLQECADNFGQLAKIAFWQKGATPFTASTILTSAAWATATADTDAGKVVVSNYITNFVIPSSAKVEQTSDTNILAMPELQRKGNVNATGMMRSVGSDVLVAMDKLTPFSQIQPGVTRLVGVFINTDNQVIYNKNRPDLGFDLFNFLTLDKDAKAQLGALSEAPIDFYLKGGWSNDAAKLQVVAFDLLNAYPAP